MHSPEQDRAVAFLSSPAAHDGADVERIDTHLSHVFLAGAKVYKIMRAVRYDFVDFSTLGLRKEACENEVIVNRRTAPEMYLGAVPIFAAPSGAAWRGEGEPIEWAVEMARFASPDQLDVMARDGRRNADTVKTLADRIADFHVNEAEARPAFRPGSSARAIVTELHDGLKQGALRKKREADIERWRAGALQELDKHEAFLDSRRRHGWVRACHGDLHLANICMFNGAPTPFDAVEFNRDLSDIDALYDLAFTLMDLARYGRRDLANILLNRYLGVTRDYSGVKVLPLFQSMRAAVRAMVSALPGQRDETAHKAGSYLDMALAYLTDADKPRMIAVGGYSATGKSTLAGKLALDIAGGAGAVVLRSDVIRKRLHGAAPEIRLSPEQYSGTKTARVYKRMLKDASRVLRAGKTVILDATFLDDETRAAAQSAAKRTGAAFHGVFLTAPRPVLLGRARQRAGGASDATASVLESQLERPPPSIRWLEADASKTPEKTLQNALTLLKEKTDDSA